MFLFKSSSALLSCDFETMCNFTQSSQDDLDWQPKSGKTNTMGTGPNHDHTSGTNKGD